MLMAISFGAVMAVAVVVSATITACNIVDRSALDTHNCVVHYYCIATMCATSAVIVSVRVHACSYIWHVRVQRTAH